MTWARTGRRLAAVLLAILAGTLAGTSRADVEIAASVMVQPVARVSRLDVDVWLNKDEGGVFGQGEPMRVNFRTNGDAFVLIYNIDTEGYIHLVYPYGPDDPDRVEGGVTYQVPSRNDPYDLIADGPTGIEYVVAIASPEPFRDLPWYLRGRYEGDEDDYGREDGDEDSGVIVGDPYLGMDRVIRRVVPPGLEDEVATDDTYFYIGRRVEYPRYVCADCHSYGGWYDPYVDVCTVVDIRIDAAWARYRPWPLRAPIVARPRYFYMVRSTAPTRYRQWKDRWSSADGRTMLRTRFQVEGTDKFRSRREVYQRRTPPEFQRLRSPRSGRVWRSPNEVLRRDRDDATGRSRDRWSRDRTNDRNPDRNYDRRNERPDGSSWQRQRELRQREGAPRQSDPRARDDGRDRSLRQRNDDRRREWMERQEQRRNEQRQEQQRQEQQRNDQRQDQRQREREMRREEQRRDDNRDRSNRESRNDQRDRGDRGDRGDRVDRGDRGHSGDRHDKPDRGDHGWGNRRGR